MRAWRSDATDDNGRGNAGLKDLDRQARVADVVDRVA
jgi:hypothetical protein